MGTSNFLVRFVASLLRLLSRKWNVLNTWSCLLFSVLFSIMTEILSSDLLNIPPKFVCWNVLAFISYVFPITFSKNIHPVDTERKLSVWTFYLHSIYVLCLRGNSLNSLFQIQMFLFPNTVLLLFLLKMPQCIFKFC